MGPWEPLRIHVLGNKRHLKDVYTTEWGREKESFFHPMISPSFLLLFQELFFSSSPETVMRTLPDPYPKKILKYPLYLFL